MTRAGLIEAGQHLTFVGAFCVGLLLTALALGLVEDWLRRHTRR